MGNFSSGEAPHEPVPLSAQVSPKEIASLSLLTSYVV